MGVRRASRLAASVLTAAAAIGLSLLAVSTQAGAATVVASVSASPDANVIDGTSLSVTGTVGSSVKSVVLIECDSTQMSTVGSPYDPNHCDVTPADEVTLPVTSNAFSGSFSFHDPLTTADGTVSCDAGCVLLADNPSPGDVTSVTMVSGNSCNGAFDGAATPSVLKTTTAGPNGATVQPGQTITVTLTWPPSDFTSAPSKDDDCVEIGTTLSTSMSQEQKPGSTTGSATFTYTVPSGGTNGEQICDRGAISGKGPVSGIEKSAILCYTVMAAVTPEAPKALLLPVAGLAVGGGGLLLARRRRNGTRPQRVK